MTATQQQPACFLLPQPVSVPVALQGGDTVMIDPYEADATLPDGLRDFMAEKLGVEAAQIAENQVRVFSDFIAEIVTGLEKDRKKKREESPLWLGYIRDCQQDGMNGQNRPMSNCSTRTDTPRLGDIPQSEPTQETAPRQPTTETSP